MVSIAPSDAATADRRRKKSRNAHIGSPYGPSWCVE
jgi:hypothetical protein